MDGYMFDTNVFNAILDNTIDVAPLAETLPLYVTHVQFDEIQATRDERRRAQLVSIFSTFQQESIPTASLAFGVSRLGQARLSNGVLYGKLRARLDELEKKGNNPQDTLIAETAIVEGLTLVRRDKNLLRVVTEFGGSACTLPEFLKKIEHQPRRSG